jgi:AcrR family transcriptional regulator
MGRKQTIKSKLKPRKSPTQERSQETVEAIIEAAAHVMEKRGLEGYTTNAIAERAGVSIGSLYQYFPNKDALTMALLERESQKMLDAVGLINPSDDFEVSLDAMLKAAVDHQLDRPILARLLDLEEMRFPQSAKLQAKSEKVRELIVAVFRQANYRFVEDDDQIAEDLIAITRSITDAAGQSGEIDKALLLKRVKRAVQGYLTQSKIN